MKGQLDYILDWNNASAVTRGHKRENKLVHSQARTRKHTHVHARTGKHTHVHAHTHIHSLTHSQNGVVDGTEINKHRTSLIFSSVIAIVITIIVIISITSIVIVIAEVFKLPMLKRCSNTLIQTESFTMTFKRH